VRWTYFLSYIIHKFGQKPQLIFCFAGLGRAAHQRETPEDHSNNVVKREIKQLFVNFGVVFYKIIRIFMQFFGKTEDFACKGM